MSRAPVITLTGGVGGAKLALGLSRVIRREDLAIVTNTGDDFTHLGLRICPDTDTVLYTLSGLSNTDLGWGRAEETWTFMKALEDYGAESWFNLGDGDLALHVLRTNRLNKGESLGKVTADFARTMGIDAKIIPMCDETVSTRVLTANGPLSFQHYFVRDRCEPAVTGFEFKGKSAARTNPLILEELEKEPCAIIIAPSNPFVSIQPILAVPDMKENLRNCGAPIVAVSPIVGGQAIKGPAAKMMQELNMPVSAFEVARWYSGFADGILIDEVDADQAEEIRKLDMSVCVTQTVMKNLEDRIKLAETSLDFAKSIRGGIVR